MKYLLFFLPLLCSSLPTPLPAIPNPLSVLGNLFKSCMMTQEECQAGFHFSIKNLNEVHGMISDLDKQITTTSRLYRSRLDKEVLDLGLANKLEHLQEEREYYRYLHDSIAKVDKWMKEEKVWGAKLKDAATEKANAAENLQSRDAAGDGHEEAALLNLHDTLGPSLSESALPPPGRNDRQAIPPLLWKLIELSRLS